MMAVRFILIINTIIFAICIPFILQSQDIHNGREFTGGHG